MNVVLITLLLQSLMLPPRTAMQNPASASAVPQKVKKDYDKLWNRFLSGKEDAKVAKDVDKLLKKQKDVAAAVALQGYLELFNGNGAAATSKFLQTLSVDQDNSVALFYLGELALAGHDYAGANNYYSRLLAVDKRRTDVEAKRQKALLLATDNLLRLASKAEQEGRFTEAAESYRRALELAPHEPSLNGRLAELLVREKKWDEALELYRNQMEVLGPNSAIEKNIAEALMNLGRTEEARQILERLRNSGSLDENLEAKVGELEDLGRWGNELRFFQSIKSADSVTREQLAAVIVRYFPQVAEFPQTPQIITDTQDSWARPEIQVSVGTGLMDPFPNHTFQPSGSITRGLFVVSMSRLMRLLSVASAGAPPIPVPDVNPGDALYKDLQLLLSSGLVTLEDTGTFNVTGTVSGEEAVRAIDRLLRLSHGQTG